MRKTLVSTVLITVALSGAAWAKSNGEPEEKQASVESRLGATTSAILKEREAGRVFTSVDRFRRGEAEDIARPLAPTTQAPSAESAAGAKVDVPPAKTPAPVIVEERLEAFPVVKARRAIVEQVRRQAFIEADACYGKRLDPSRSIARLVTIEVSVDAAGKVTQSQNQGADSQLSSCLSSRAGNWSLRNPLGAPVTATATFLMQTPADR